MRPSLPFDQVSWPVGTARLSLRRAQPADADAVFAYRSKPEVAQWIRHLETDPEEWRRVWDLFSGDRLVVLRDDSVIGDLRIMVCEGVGQAEVQELWYGSEAELAWVFNPAAHGNGYATEALTAIVELSFSELGLRRLFARCYAGNEPSWRVMERLGMRREARHVRQARHRDGTWHDMLTYALLAPGA